MVLNNQMKKLGIFVLASLLVYFMLHAIGLNSYVIYREILQFGTLYALPWIALYWLIRGVKAIESRNS